MVRAVRVLCTFVVLVFAPAVVFAQASITGVVKDTSGAVLPGVTVEAASPALIEKVRTAVTDGSGQYRIIDLRPGQYTVTFTLTGFSVIQREGVTVTGTAVTTVNADMQVGQLAETVQVTGETPLVDTQSTTRSRVVSNETINTIPNSRMVGQIAGLIPGMTLTPAGAGTTQDVGGSGGDPFTRMAIHGSRISDERITISGVTFGEGNGQTHGMGPNMAAAAEVSIDTSGVDASLDAGGVRMNVIPKDGGNRFSGNFFFSGATTGMQGDNIDDELRSLGINASAPIKQLYDISPSVGGPIVQNRLWFFTTWRRAVADNYVLGLFENSNPTGFTYVPSTTQAVGSTEQNWATGRVTWQASPKNKVAVAYDWRNKCLCPSIGNATTSPEAAVNVQFKPMDLVTVNYTSPITNKLLFEAGMITLDALRQHLAPGTGNINSVTEQRPLPGQPSTYRAPTGTLYNEFPTINTDFKVSYVTGAHSFQTGVQYRHGRDDVQNTPVAPQYTLTNGVPTAVQVFARPIWVQRTLGADMGIYAQDRWTIKRLTLNGGVRFDYVHTFAPETHVAPTTYTPTVDVTFPKTDLVRWKDFSPRMGAVYDVRGDGRTALRVTFNRYVAIQGANSAGGFGVPANEVQQTATRAWTDSNRNFVADCDLTNGAAQDRTGSGGDLCGPWTGASVNFGTAVPGTRVDPDVAFGWGKREYNWEFTTAAIQQIGSRVSVDVGFFRRWYGNFRVTDNTLVGKNDYAQFVVTTPNDARLPDGGNQVIDGLLNINPDAAVRGVRNIYTFADNFGDQSEHWTGFDFGFNMRAARGLMLQGGTSTGRAITDNCGVVNNLPEMSFGVGGGTPFPTGNPIPLDWCHIENAIQTQVKAQGTYLIPRIDVQVSGTLQNLPGTLITSNNALPNSAVEGSLGRPLSGGAATVTVPYVQPGTLYGERTTQIDLRLSKILRFGGGTRASLSLDLYNLTNSNAKLTYSTNYSQFLVPTTILAPRLLKFTGQFDF